MANFKKGEFELDDNPKSSRPKETEGKESQKLLNEHANRKLARYLNIDHSVPRQLKVMGNILKVGR